MKQLIEVSSFEVISSFTSGHISLELTIGPVRTLDKFYVIEGLLALPTIFYWANPGSTNIRLFVLLPPVCEGLLKGEEFHTYANNSTFQQESLRSGFI